MARFLVTLRQSKIVPMLYLDLATINKQPRIIVGFSDRSLCGIVSFEFVNERVSSIFAVVNPEKLNLLASK